jgi:hypothetical protein
MALDVSTASCPGSMRCSWIARDLARPENEAAWSHLQAIEAGRSRIELFDMIWWMHFRQIQPFVQPDSSLRLREVSRL